MMHLATADSMSLPMPLYLFALTPLYPSISPYVHLCPHAPSLCPSTCPPTFPHVPFHVPPLQPPMPHTMSPTIF